MCVLHRSADAPVRPAMDEPEIDEDRDMWDEAPMAGDVYYKGNDATLKDLAAQMKGTMIQPDEKLFHVESSSLSHRLHTAGAE